MKLTQAIVLLLLLIISLTDIAAQGFGGSRLIASYNLGIFHAASYRNYNRTGEAREYNYFTSYNTSHYLELDYVLSRASVIGVTHLRYRTNDKGWGAINRDQLHIYARGIGVYYKIFKAKKGAIAPIGTWWKFQLTRMAYRAEEILNPENTDTSDTFDFRLALGRQIVLFSRILFNISIEAAAPIPRKYGSEEGYLEPGGFYLDRMDSYNAINAKIGLSLPIY